jgi:Cu-Zn family superoxide dismutase
VLTALLVVALAWLIGRAPIGAQQATPATGLPAAGATLAAPDGTILGTATFTEGDDSRVTVTVTVLQGLTPGEHGIHVHEVGTCDPTGDQPFASAGEHFNPTGAPHPEHAGDLGNIAAMANGSAQLQLTTNRFTLSPGPASLQDADGSALVIHEGRDDLQTDPSGNSGGRIACGVIELGQASQVPEASPNASPGASPAAPAGVPTVEAPPVAAAATPGVTGQLTVESHDIYFQPTALTIPADTPAMVSLPNLGAAVHSFVVDALGINVQIAPGATEQAVITAPAGTYEYYCDVPGHRAAGMVGTLIVE